VTDSFARKPSGPSATLLGALVIIVLSLVLLIPDWDPSLGELLVLLVSGPLFIASCLVPFLYRRDGRSGIGVVFTIVCVVYLLTFGVRAYYLIAFPSVHIFPNFDPSHDMVDLHRGLLWAALGVASMTIAYAWTRVRWERSGLTADVTARQRIRQDLFRIMSSGKFIAGLFFLGILGQAYLVGTGQNTYLFNSPSFDTFATRSDPVLTGIAGLLSDLGPLAVGIMAARQWGLGWRNRRFLILGVMTTVEAAYFLLGSYKYGLLGVLFIPIIALAARGRRAFSVRGIVAGAAFVLVILPITNSARTQLIGFYTGQQTIESGFVGAVLSSAGHAFDTSADVGAARFFLDPFFIRLDGVEALAVSEKYLPQQGHAWGATYGNIFALAVPRVIRPWSSAPSYIPFETEYVGFASTNFTVVPMPAIVEAYLNFDLPGVVFVMFLLGLIYARIDALASAADVPPFAAGLLAYAGWKMLDIETNVFIVFLPMIKVILVVFAIGAVYRVFSRPASLRPDLVLSRV
jgi:hypothetical protein